MRTLMIGAVAAALAWPAGAAALPGTGTLDSIALPGAANSVVLGPDGSLYATLPAERTVVRIAPDGTQTQTADLGGPAAGITLTGGKVWAAVTTLKKVVAIDPADLSAVTTVPTPPGNCGPVAIADGGNGSIYVSLPDTGSCGASAVVSITTAGVVSTPVTGLGQAFDLLVTGGKLFIPDFGSDRIRRVALSPALTVDATYVAPGGAAPNGLGLAPSGEVVVSYYGTGGLARFSAAAAGGEPTVFATGLVEPFGVATIGGSVFAPSRGGTPSLRRYPADGALAPVTTLQAGARPSDVSPGPDGTAIVTDLDNARLLRFTSRAPRATTGDPSNLNTGSARVSAVVNPGGNAAVTTFEYGPTTAYGSFAVASPVVAAFPPVVGGTADVAVQADLSGLGLGGTYHYRAVAVTAEGTAYGPDRTFTTAVKGGPARPEDMGKSGVPALGAKVGFVPTLKQGVARVTKIKVSGLVGGETIKVTCSGKGCPAKKKDRTVTTKVKKAGTLTVKASKITKARLAKKAKVTVQVTKSGFVGVVSTITRTSAKRISTKTLCLQPGASKPTACAEES